jgi:hypothetical protein
MSADDQPATSSTRPQPRSAKRKMISWIILLILVPALGWEIMSMNDYERAIKEVIDLIGPPDETAINAITAAQVKAVLRGKSPQVTDVSTQNLFNGGKRFELYRWFSINPYVERKLYVYYGAGQDAKVVCATMIEDTQAADDMLGH